MRRRIFLYTSVACALVHLRMRTLKPLTIACALAAAGSFANPAHAFRTAGDTPQFEGTERVRWHSPIELRAYTDLPVGLSSDDVARAIAAAMAAWMTPACSGAELRFGGAMTEHATPDDRVNTIEWIQHGWAERGFAPDAAATTEVGYERRGDGEWAIAEADVFLNAETFRWIAADDHGPELQDAQSVLTHEIGHVLGLLHPCEVGGQDGAPDCSKMPEATALTMYPVHSAQQATLEDDDVAGACFLYPAPSCDAITCGSGELCVDGRCREACGTTACGTGEFCEDGACHSIEVPPDPPDAGSEPPPAHPLGAVGDPCTLPGDCAGGECLDIDGIQRQCTQSCGNAAQACPANWGCGSVEQKAVCVPIEPAGGGGCALTSSPSEPHLPSVLAATVLLLVLGRRKGA